MIHHALRGREAELAAAHALLAQSVRTGQGAVLVISGQGGIGKTALLREIAGHAGRIGFDVGVGRAEESDQISPMTCLLVALRSGREPLLSREAFAGMAPVQHQPLWVVDLVVDELEARAAHRPVLVCIDDLQWADHSSLFAVGVLPGRLAGSPVVWAVSTRPGSRSAADLARIVSRDLEVRTIRLRPLDAASIEQLAEDRLGDRLDARVRHQLEGADGVPFLAVALLDGLAAERPDGARATGSGLPEHLVLDVRATVESLPAGTVRLVRNGAVLGRSFTVADAAALLGGPATETVLPWLEPAVRAGVLRDTGERIVFQHDLLRQAVHADLPPSVRQDLHRAAARHVLDTGGSVVDAADHVLSSATVGDLDAVDVLRRAAQATAGHAPSTAAELAERAFRLLRVTDTGWAETGVEAVALLDAADRGGEARAVADALLAQEVDDDLAARVQVEVAQAMWARGELDGMRARVERAGRLGGVHDRTRTHLLALGALARSRDDDTADAVRTAYEALTRAETTDDAAAATTALKALGEMARNDGRNGAALGWFRRMRRVSGADYSHDEVLSLQLLDRLDESAAVVHEAEDRATSAGLSSPPDVSFGLMWQGFTRGSLEDTETHARSLVRMGEEVGRYSFHSEARVLLCRVAQLRGDLPAAREQLALARRHVGRDTSRELVLTIARGWLGQASGDHEEALAAVRAVVLPARPLRHRWLWQPGWLLPALEVAVRGGDARLAGRIVDLTRTLHLHDPGVPTNAALATCARGLTTGSTALVQEALEQCRTSPRLMTRAQITRVLGQSLLRDGDRDAGVATLDDAWDQFTELGAHGEARVVQHLLQETGVRRRRWTVAGQRPATGWGALTSSEQRVARLVAQGHTNRSAARELVLSPNTIATHLRSVFTKLGVRSRVQLSLAVAQLAG